MVPRAITCKRDTTNSNREIRLLTSTVHGCDDSSELYSLTKSEKVIDEPLSLPSFSP